MNDELAAFHTNSADDSSGVAFKLDGNLYIPVIGAALLSVGLLTGLIWADAVSTPIAFLVAAIPFALTLFVVLTFFQGKEPHYAADWMADRTTDGSFVRYAQAQPTHPMERLAAQLTKGGK
jgi:hypothetical protein